MKISLRSKGKRVKQDDSTSKQLDNAALKKKEETSKLSSIIFLERRGRMRL